MFTQLKKCDPCGKNPLAYVFVFLGLRLPFHQEEYEHPGLRLLLKSSEFSPQNRGALSQPVFVHTQEYLIRHTLCIPSHIFMGNSHLPLTLPWMHMHDTEKRNLPFSVTATRSLRFYLIAACLYKPRHALTRKLRNKYALRGSKSVSSLHEAHCEKNWELATISLPFILISKWIELNMPNNKQLTNLDRLKMFDFYCKTPENIN